MDSPRKSDQSPRRQPSPTRRLNSHTPETKSKTKAQAFGSEGSVGPESKAQIFDKNIFAKDILARTVDAEFDRSTRRTGVSTTIEQLKDNRGVFTYIIDLFKGISLSTEQKNAWVSVQDRFTDYAKVGVRMPPDIQKSGGTSLLSADEVETLKKLAYLGEQNLMFSMELKGRPGVTITGNLKDVFQKDKPPTRETLMGYCNSLKRLFNEQGYFPPQVTEDPNPQVFKFYLGGEPKTVTVETVADLDDLQEKLNLCNKAGDNLHRDDRSKFPQRETIDAKDPFVSQVTHGAEKRKIIADLGMFGKDDLVKDDRILPAAQDALLRAVGTTSKHTARDKVARQDLRQQIEIAFDNVVKGDNPGNQGFKETVWPNLNEAVQKKLKDGEVLTPAEVKELRDVTFSAMQRQRYIDDLRKGIPAEIKGDFIAAFTGEMPEKTIIENYLFTLRAELKRGGYSEFIYANPDVTKFQFFDREGKRFFLQINTENKTDFIAGLAKLQEALEGSRNLAIAHRRAINMPQKVTVPAQPARVDATLPARVDATLLAELEQLRAEKNEAVKAKSELEQKVEQERAQMRQTIRGADKKVAEGAFAAERSIAEAKREYLVNLSAARTKEIEQKAALEKLEAQVQTTAEKYKRLEATQQSAEEAIAKAKAQADKEVTEKISKLEKAVASATAEKEKLLKEQQDIVNQLALEKEGVGRINLEKVELEQRAKIDAAEKAELTKKADLAKAEIDNLKLETKSNENKIAELQKQHQILLQQYDLSKEKLQNETIELSARLRKMEASIQQQLEEHKEDVVGIVDKKIERTKEQLEKEVALMTEFEVLKKQKDELEKKIEEQANIKSDILVAEYLIENIDSMLPSLGKKYASLLLRLAVLRGDIKLIEELFKLDELDLNSRDWCGVTPLHLAVEGRNLEVIRILVQRNGIEVNKGDVSDTTALHRAIDWLPSSISKVEVLLKAPNIDVNVVNFLGNTPLQLAARENNFNVVKALLAKGADVNLADKDGDTPLYWAIFNRNIEMVQLLLRVDGIKVDSKLLKLARDAMNITETTDVAIAASKNAQLIYKLIEDKKPVGFFEALATAALQMGPGSEL